MPKYILAYHGTPKFETKEDGMNHMTAWRAWSSGLGDALVEPGWPAGPSTTLESDGSVSEGGGSNPIAGVTVIEAASLEAALEMVKPCPHLSAGGTIEVAEAMDMEM